MVRPLPIKILNDLPYRVETSWELTAGGTLPHRQDLGISEAWAPGYTPLPVCHPPEPLAPQPGDSAPLLSLCSERHPKPRILGVA